MRDPNRIEPFLEELGGCWRKVPDWRFGQLMINFLGAVSTKVDPFFPEEDKMLEYLHEYFDNGFKIT